MYGLLQDEGVVAAEVGEDVHYGDQLGSLVEDDTALLLQLDDRYTLEVLEYMIYK